MKEIYVFQLLYSTYVLLQMCAPAVIVEGIKKQMETVKYKLYNRLMEDNGRWSSLYYILYYNLLYKRLHNAMLRERTSIMFWFWLYQLLFGSG